MAAVLEVAGRGSKHSRGPADMAPAHTEVGGHHNTLVDLVGEEGRLRIGGRTEVEEVGDTAEVGLVEAAGQEAGNR